MVNRAAIMMRYKDPAVRWINEADPYPYEDDLGVTAESVNHERTVYLVSDEDGDGDQAVSRWVKRNFKALFETELESWYTDPDLWPKKRTFKLFQQWFAVECHSMLIDTVGGKIYDDEISSGDTSRFPSCR